MERKIQLTNDGSHTIAVTDMHVTYHSLHGAIQESMHVFIEAGLKYVWERFFSDPVEILEVGFGTGLNALLTWQEAIRQQRNILYRSIEAFPLNSEETDRLNHGRLLDAAAGFQQIHKAPWEKVTGLDAFFSLQKIQVSLLDFCGTSTVHCIYFDVFAPAAQPELWTQQVFENLYRCMVPGGVLVTYCSKSDIRRAMSAAGFNVTKIKGPYGKREMVRAIK